MKIIKLIFLLFFCLGFVACKMYAVKKYHLERDFNFKDKMSFLNYLNRKKIFDENQLLYLDSASYLNFYLEKLQQDSSVIYQGCYLNDSICINSSRFLSENTSCMGRIQNEVALNLSLSTYPDSILVKVKNISSYTLRYLKNDAVFNISAFQKKIKIFLVYTYATGTYYDSLYKDILAINKSNNSNAEVFIICIDPLHTLN